MIMMKMSWSRGRKLQINPSSWKPILSSWSWLSSSGLITLIGDGDDDDVVKEKEEADQPISCRIKCGISASGDNPWRQSVVKSLKHSFHCSEQKREWQECCTEVKSKCSCILFCNWRSDHLFVLNATIQLKHFHSFACPFLDRAPMEASCSIYHCYLCFFAKHHLNI